MPERRVRGRLRLSSPWAKRSPERMAFASRLPEVSATLPLTRALTATLPGAPHPALARRLARSTRSPLSASPTGSTPVPRTAVKSRRPVSLHSAEPTAYGTVCACSGSGVPPSVPDDVAWPTPPPAESESSASREGTVRHPALRVAMLTRVSRSAPEYRVSTPVASRRRVSSRVAAHSREARASGPRESGMERTASWSAPPDTFHPAEASRRRRRVASRSSSSDEFDSCTRTKRDAGGNPTGVVGVGVWTVPGASPIGERFDGPVSAALLHPERARASDPQVHFEVSAREELVLLGEHARRKDPEEEGRVRAGGLAVQLQRQRRGAGILPTIVAPSRASARTELSRSSAAGSSRAEKSASIATARRRRPGPAGGTAPRGCSAWRARRRRTGSAAAALRASRRCGPCARTR